MIESELSNLFDPPVGTCAIVIPCSGQVEDNATMGVGYAKQAKKKWPALAKVLGYYNLKFGVRSHPLTFRDLESERIYIHGGNAAEVKWHIISFPTRMHDHAKIDPSIVARSAQDLATLCMRLPELKETGLVVLPQLHDAHFTWDKLRVYVEPYIPEDRFVVILGNQGTPT